MPGYGDAESSALGGDNSSAIALANESKTSSGAPVKDDGGGGSG